MMATEAISKDTVDAPAIAEPEQISTSSGNQDVSSDQPPVAEQARVDTPSNDTDQVEVVATSADVSVNGGSDTEAIKSKTQGEGHTRSSSTVKKSFKAVSVNKTFLAAKGAAGATPVKVGDKGAAGSTITPLAPSTLNVSKPRLVAKSGSGLGQSNIKSSTAANGGKAAPDGNAVWNKNRPAPVPEPKRLTDEELSQKFGIHLATRLQSDDPSRQANWADIDDDDEDWAPETIEWTDGTKITLPQQVDEPAPEPPKPTPPVTSTKPTSKPASPAPPAPTSTMKLGGMAGGTGRGLVLKGTSEKPVLVAKPPGPPTPVKSPWAPLPPVEKAPPIVAELSQQQHQQPRFNQRDPHGFDAMPPPAKEIAADDFSRSWRDGSNNTSRELYNSQSGRYEPVNDGRKGSLRNDHSRQPALLQRHHEMQGPAEPSSAFQTHRANLQDPVYGRRRTSSNVSGGSGNFVRRVSRGVQDMHPPHDLMNDRRGSLVAVSDSPSSPVPSRVYPQQQWQPRASPALSHASPASVYGQMVQGPPSGGQLIPLEDELELQKKIMRETREQARKRRLEEEAREEAARKERIRLKLEAMGPPPETNKSKKEKEATKDDKPVPTHIQSRDTPSTADASTTSTSTTKLPSLPKPPTIEAEGEVKQYGLMKVHHPETVKNSVSTSATNAEPTISQLNEEVVVDDHHANGINPSVPSSRGRLDTPSAPSAPTQPHSWQNSQTANSERYPSWANPTSHSSQGRNVWGPPPSNDRTLGNGTFNPELSMQPPPMANSGPGPIGPPNANRPNGQYQARGPQQYSQRPAPIGPPNRQQEQRAISDQRAEEQRLADEHRAKAIAAWHQLPAQLALEDARLREEQEKKDALRRELGSAAVEPPRPIFRDTWRQVVIRDDGTRELKSITTTVSGGEGQPQPASSFKDFKTPQQAANEFNKDFDITLETSSQILAGIPPHPTSNSTGSSTGRGSRFFPQSKDVRLEELSDTRPGSPSPPPPTMAGHPAYDGDSAHPHVSLPRPPPVVRLPPPASLAPIGPPKPTTFAAAAASPVGTPLPRHPAAMAHSHQQSPFIPSGPKPTQGQNSGAGGWQDRIDSLIGRRHAPGKSQALAVDSSSKNALEQHHMSATVSLPNVAGIASDDDLNYQIKPLAEECFEEQEMGSLPAVRVPNKAPELAWNIAPAQTKPLPRKFVLADTTTADPLTFDQQVTNNGDAIHIFIPGMTEEKYISVPRRVEPRQKSNPRRNGPSRGHPQRHPSAPHAPRGGRSSRDASSSFAPATPDNASTSSSPASSSRSGGRGRAGFGGNWNRHVSTPQSAVNAA